jgi:hypothetical protein
MAFLALTLLAVVAGFAAVSGFATVAALVARRRFDRAPGALRYLAVAGLVGGIAVAGFGVLAAYDEAPALAGFFLLSVFVPLALIVGRLRRSTDAGAFDTATAASMAWSLPFVLGAVVFLGLVIWLGRTFSSAEIRRLGAVWLASAGAGVVVATAGLLLADRVVGLAAGAPADPEGPSPGR